jgi:tubulin-specific chaperone D
MASVTGLVAISGELLRRLTSPSSLESYLPPDIFHLSVGGILKQGVERLDNVRQLVGEELTRLVSLTRTLSIEFSRWKPYGMELLEPLVAGSVSMNLKNP